MAGEKECFVYITLPGETAAVTAGRLRCSATAHGIRKAQFVYGRSYLARKDAVEIDPIDLRLQTLTLETTAQNGLFGALRDAAPDYWGRRVIDRHAGAGLSELDYLLHSPNDRAGALGFGFGVQPPAPLRQYNQTLQLEVLQELADRLIREDQITGSGALQVEELLLLGTSMGGARPKAVVEDSQGLWLAKFNRHDDRWNMARIEHAMLLLARECGLDTPPSRVDLVGNRDVLLVKRFDRAVTKSGYTRARMVSALTLLQADESNRERWSYVVLSEQLRKVSEQPKEDATEIFRRMVFNALISNTDDHPRNHAVIAPARGWRLSPAYDLTPTSPVAVDRRDLAMQCGDLGRWAYMPNLLSQCGRFLLSESEAISIVSVMQAIVRERWYALCRACGVSEVDCSRIAGAFVYPGLNLATK
jgi:serine/threonine-protein kinase HipA